MADEPEFDEAYVSPPETTAVPAAVPASPPSDETKASEDVKYGDGKPFRVVVRATLIHD